LLKQLTIASIGEYIKLL